MITHSKCRYMGNYMLFQESWDIKKHNTVLNEPLKPNWRGHPIFDGKIGLLIHTSKYKQKTFLNTNIDILYFNKTLYKSIPSKIT